MKFYKLRFLLALAVLSSMVTSAQTQTLDTSLSTDCHYEIIEGKSPVISAKADSTWHTYRPELEVDSDEDDTELCQKRCCAELDCELVAITRNEVSNNTECVLFKCEEGGCSLKNNDRYNVHLKSKRASLSTPPHQTVNDKTVTEETIGHTTTFSQEQPELQHEATTPASDLTTTTTERNIAIKTGYLPPETGKSPPEPGLVPPETVNIPLETGSIPSEMGSTPPETGYVPPETGKIPDKTSPLINDKISFEDHDTGSESPDLTANPPTSVLDETLTSKTNTDDGGDEENVAFTTLMPPPNHKDGMVTTAHSPVVTNHMTTLTIPHTTNGDRDKGFIAITPVPKNPPTTDRITTSTSDPDDKPVTESITTTKPANLSIGPSEHLQNTNRTDTPTTTYNNDTIAEVKPYIWQVPWWYDGTVNQQHVTLFAMLLIGVTMALIVGFCIARICIRSWRVKRRTRKGYLYLSRFM